MKSKSQIKKVSLQDKIRISHLGLKAQGSVPWTKDETDTFLSLYLELSNKKTKSSKTIQSLVFTAEVPLKHRE